MPVGKIQPPSVHPDEEPLVCIQVNIGWIPYLIGMVWPAKYPEYWAGTLEENRTARKDVMTLMSILQAAGDCDDMSKDCCVEPVIIKRINQESGFIEQSTDNGITWTMAGGGFPSVVIQPVPPVTNGVAATKCDAATNLSVQVQAWIDHVSDDLDTATTLLEFGLALIGAAAAAILAVLSLGALAGLEALLLPVFGAAGAAVFAVGKVAFDDYWTTEVKDAILCAAYCNIGDDGSFTDAQFSAFWNKVNTDLPGSVVKMLFMGFLSSVGTQGVNSMAASGLSADADCADCACGECSDCDIRAYVITDERENPLTYEDDMCLINGDSTLIVGNYYWSIKAPFGTCCFTQINITGDGPFTVLAGPCDYSGELSLDEGSGWSPMGLTRLVNNRGWLVRSPTSFTCFVSV